MKKAKVDKSDKVIEKSRSEEKGKTTPTQDVKKSSSDTATVAK